jgi:undecaprenyl-phosphate 4-deoxy-4-formamido-L-arabinose transferase
MRNYGQHNALMCGFRHARGAYVITMDDDLQNPPEEIPRLYDAIHANGLDLVYGAYDIKKHGKLRNLGSSLINWFYRQVFRTPVTVTSFRIIRRKLLESIFSYSLNFTFVDGLLAWNTQRVGQVLVDHQPRRAGRSGYSVGKLVVLGLNLFTNFSLLPLQMISVLGLLMAAAGFLAGFYYLCQVCLSQIAVPGYASTIIAIMVFGGVQMMALGIMGEYVGRLHLNVNRKPQYFVRHIAAREDETVRRAA